MIQRIADFALRQRLAVLIGAIIVALVGLDSFFNVPIEAYPDVGDTQVTVITQWLGHASEEVEQQITLPIERAMNGTPHQNSVRSVSIAGLSVVTTTFEDGTDDYFARQMALERLAQLSLPPGVGPALGPLASPIGEILRYQLVNCAGRDLPECGPADREQPPASLSSLKDLEEWVIEKELLAVDGVADVASFGGTVLEYQVRVDPARMVARDHARSDLQGPGQRQRERRGRRDPHRARIAQRQGARAAQTRGTRQRRGRHPQRDPGAGA